jgi:hypothetical protein
LLINPSDLAENVPHAPSSTEDVQAAIGTVESARQDWMHLSSDDKVELVKSCMSGLLAGFEAFAADAAAHKGTHGTGTGEEMCVAQCLLSLL